MDNLSLADQIEYTMWVIETETAYLQQLIAQAERQVAYQNAAAHYALAAITESMGEAA